MPDLAVTPGPLHRADPRHLGPYRLVARLSAGGMGRVYLAVETGTGELAAVKTLLAEGEIGDADRARFAREVGVARRVAGRHTARVRAADPEAERPWLATDYVSAPSLAELTARGGPADPATVARLAADCATALEALHTAGVVHRDLKPQNVLLPADGIRVIDFGISHATDLTRTRLTLGTLAYIAPEQARGEPATPACDVYALGATLCTLATGRPPSPDTGDPVRLLALVARGAVELGAVPEPLLGLVRACLALDPAARPGPVALRMLAQEAGAAAAAGPAGGGGGGASWPGMPDRWAGIVLAYQRQGRELTERYGGGGAEAPAPAEPAGEAWGEASAQEVRAPGTSAPRAQAPGASAPGAPAPRASAPEAPPATPAPDPATARRFAGLTPRGWRAAGSLVGNCAGLAFLVLGTLAVVGTIIAIVVAVALE
ncbi:serine/threonine-protein kinase [Streptomyces sp. WMMC500]|uniref:serine/threonine-protein kinase n=1 Tax=Streptomyces sp. WMMC500 TaxID=3015154 RepID=UPI00248BA35F|nr:serine/threonine-protein kinase [Streptomyces sp. WMMC500]WBB57979.1 serine/threonine-protein kinase [Streptomyces sp. WMMC500]